MPAHSFGGKDLPMTTRVARGLLFLQGGIMALSGIFVLLIALLFGSGTSIPVAGASFSGASAALLAVGYLALAAFIGYVALALGREVSWARTAAVVLEAVLIVLTMARGDFSVSMVVSVLLCIAVAALLLLPSSPTASTEA